MTPMTEASGATPVPPLAHFAAETARLLPGAWSVAASEQRDYRYPAEAFLDDGDQRLHVFYDRDELRVIAQGVDTFRTRGRRPSGENDYLGDRASVALRRGAGALAAAITTRVLPRYQHQLRVQRDYQAASQAAAAAQREDAERLLARTPDGQLDRFFDTLTVRWPLAGTDATAAARLDTRRPPGTVELSFKNVPVHAVAPLIATVRDMLAQGGQAA